MTESVATRSSNKNTNIAKDKSKFATPDRDELSSHSKEPTPKSQEEHVVTPLDIPSSANKTVRFDASDTPTKRGLVSRRGGRYGSPARTEPYNRRETDSDGVPSLCSNASGEHKEPPPAAPSQISCGAVETTSPLQEESPKKGQPETSSTRNVTFSPRPSSSDGMDRMTKKTPTRSPSGGHFHNLPSLQDAKLSSPCGIFLSPCPPSPSAYATIAANPSYEEEKSSKHAMDRPCATPTDFAVDFGKGHQSSASFDASNVLAWLQSPTANGLFSPGGGFGSALNTPRGSRTPRTPTMSSTSFFFSDVASLPRNGEFASPREKQQRMQISISPLASRKGKQPTTPLRDVFTSPRSAHKPRSMPMLGESPSCKKGNHHLDAMHMAERDLMEDEDLSVLLQLASSNTPRAKDGSDVFRSPHMKGDYRDSRDPGLQLPIIGGSDGTGSTKLIRKNVAEADSNADDFAPPTLGIRSSSSGASREMYTRDDGEKPTPVKSSKESTKENDDSTKKKSTKSKKKHKSQPHSGYPMQSYPPRDGPYYPMPGSMPPMPPGGSMRVIVGAPPPMNSRKKASGSPGRHPSPPRHGPYSMPPDGYGAPPPGSMYPPPHYQNYPPHMGVPPPYGHYPHPPPHHMPMYSSSHPPQQPKGSSNNKNSSKKTKAPKPSKSSTSIKRPADEVTSSSSSPGSCKKTRKLTPVKTPVGPPKKKKAAAPEPGVVTSGEPVDRQKAAAKIAAVNQASGGMNDRAAALAAAILRGVTMRPSGKWQAQLYYAGKSRYIGVFDTREKAALAYEIAREVLKSDNKTPADQSAQSLKATENAVNAARKAAFEGVNEKDPRITGK